MRITLKAARVNANLTQEEMATEMGVTKQTIIAWETGKRPVKPVYLPLISQVTGCPVDDIILPTEIT